MTPTQSVAAVLLVAVGLAAAPVAAQDIPAGMFVDTPDGPQEVAVYATRTAAGRLRLSVGRLDDVQTVSGVVRLICSLPMWRVRSIFLSTSRILDDERAERRVLSIRIRQLNVTTTIAQVVASEDPAELRRLVRQVGGNETNPAYLFVTMQSGSSVRDYIVGVEPEPE